jgi:hypothetical protein
MKHALLRSKVADFRKYYSTGHPFKVLKKAIIMSRIHVVLSQRLEISIDNW